jgi:hypothetical protein
MRVCYCRIRVLHGLSWRWIAVMVTAPPCLGALVAYPIWRTSQIILGNLAGAGVIFGAALALILRESVELDRLTRQCVDAGYLCFPDPSAFTRYAIYAFIGLIEVFGVFAWSLRVERQMRDSRYAPEWR